MDNHLVFYARPNGLLEVTFTPSQVESLCTVVSCLSRLEAFSFSGIHRITFDEKEAVKCLLRELTGLFSSPVFPVENGSGVDFIHSGNI